MNKSPLVLTKNCPVLLSSVNRQQSVNLYSRYVPANKNNLIAEAGKIFTIITRLKNKTSDDLKKLKKSLFREVENFVEKIRLFEFDEDCVFACNYALNLCIEGLFTVEKNSVNNSQKFPNVTVADRERFFIILDKFCREPKKFIDVIELVYICFILGFDSQLKSDNDMQLSMDCVYQIIRLERGEIEKKLSFLEPYRNSFKRAKTKSLFFPVFKILFGSFVIICGMYIGTYYLLKIFSEQIVNNLSYVQINKEINLSNRTKNEV